MPKDKISYRVYKHTRVKHTISFFGEAVYPVYVTVMYGQRSLNFKSRLFEHILHQPDYNMPAPASAIESIMQQESQLVASIIEQLNSHFTPAAFKEQYIWYTTDVLQYLEQQVKQFLIDFFSNDDMPSIASLISNMPDKLPAATIIKDLEKSLSPSLLQKLLTHTFFKQTPYIPLKRFYESAGVDQLPIMTIYHFQNKAFCDGLAAFLLQEFPQYAGFNFTLWTNQITVNSTSFSML